MTYSTLMVLLETGTPNAGLLQVAADLAQRFRANVIGIATSQPMPIVYSDGYTSGDMIELDRIEIDKEMKEAEVSFRSALQGKATAHTWRSTKGLGPLADYVAREGRAADLLITAPDSGWSAFDSERRVVVSDLVLGIGRPVLIVPRGVDKVELEHVVIGWNETREARRAIADALPFLKLAGRVTVVEIAAESDIPATRKRLEDIVSWLGQHDVAAQFLAVPSAETDAASLDMIAREQGAGLLVAGAYGHNRLREWVLGGVTRSLLMHPTRCALLSH